MVSVNKYIKNVGKSVLYTTADVMKEKFDYITDFKSTNSDLMKDTYNAIKDYKTTFTRMKKECYGIGFCTMLAVWPSKTYSKILRLETSITNKEKKNTLINLV